MKTEKKTQVVMLRTRTNSVLSKAYLANPSYLRFKESSFKDDSYSSNDNQHLYFLSDDEIKEGDWFIGDKISLKQCTLNNGGNINFKGGWYSGSSNCKKIIASTDESLGLPRPSNAFIQKYVEEYNKGNIITEVMVEYEVLTTSINNKHFGGGHPYTIPELKIKPDNTIICSAVEETWDDVFSNWMDYYNNGIGLKLKLMEYLKENYQVPKQIK